MSLGAKLKSLRLREKNTLQEQSEILGVSMNSVYRWEHDLAIPRNTMLKSMASYFNVPLEWLLLERAGEPIEDDTEQQLLSMFRKLSPNSKYKVLGHIEHMCIEEYRSE